MNIMKNDADMLEEYDFTEGVRGKYAAKYAEGTNVVVIDPDVAQYFSDRQLPRPKGRSLQKGSMVDQGNVQSLMAKTKKGEH